MHDADDDVNALAYEELGLMYDEEAARGAARAPATAPAPRKRRPKAKPATAEKPNYTPQYRSAKNRPRTVHLGPRTAKRAMFGRRGSTARLLDDEESLQLRARRDFSATRRVQEDRKAAQIREYKRRQSKKRIQENQAKRRIRGSIKASRDDDDDGAAPPPVYEDQNDEWTISSDGSKLSTKPSMVSFADATPAAAADEPAAAAADGARRARRAAVDTSPEQPTTDRAPSPVARGVAPDAPAALAEKKRESRGSRGYADDDADGDGPVVQPVVQVRKVDERRALLRRGRKDRGEGVALSRKDRAQIGRVKKALNPEAEALEAMARHSKAANRTHKKRSSPGDQQQQQLPAASPLFFNCECVFSLFLVALLAALPFNINAGYFRQSRESFVMRAEELFSDGAFGTAAALYQRAVDAEETPDGHVFLAETLVRVARVPDAIAHYERAAALYDDARERLDPGLRSPEVADAHVQLAAYSLGAGSRGGLYDRRPPPATEIALTLAAAHLLLADGYRDLGLPEHAIESLRSVVKYRPRDAAGLSGLGAAHLELGHFKQSVNAYRKAHALAPAATDVNGPGRGRADDAAAAATTRRRRANLNAKAPLPPLNGTVQDEPHLFAQVHGLLFDDQLLDVVLETLRSALDLVVAVDAVPYLGDLADFFGAVASVLRPGGLAIFNTDVLTEDGLEPGSPKKARDKAAESEGEAAAEPGTIDYRLAFTGRWQHRVKYVTGLARAHGFASVKPTMLLKVETRLVWNAREQKAGWVERGSKEARDAAIRTGARATRQAPKAQPRAKTTQ
ncbi:hypothetical protein JL720_7456 [Aureococcus anophagefferens]|nr:hypothetical protein JL720_7456 [Aureococcus anophagefferens]